MRSVGGDGPADHPANRTGNEGRRTYGTEEERVQQAHVRRTARRVRRELRPREPGRMRRRWRRGRHRGRRQRRGRRSRQHHLQPDGRPARARPGVLRRRRVGHRGLQHPRGPLPLRREGRDGRALPGHRPARDLGRRPRLHHQAARGRQVPRRRRVQRRSREEVHRAPARAQPHLRHALRVVRVRRRGDRQRRRERRGRGRHDGEDHPARGLHAVSEEPRHGAGLPHRVPDGGRRRHAGAAHPGAQGHRPLQVRRLDEGRLDHPRRQRGVLGRRPPRSRTSCSRSSPRATRVSPRS